MKYFSNKKNYFSAAAAAILPAAIFFLLISALCPIEGSAKPAKNKAAAEARVQNEKAAAAESETAADAAEPVKSEVQAAPKKEEAPLKEFTADDFGPKTGEESYGWTIFKLLFILGLMGGGFYYFFRFVTKRAGMNVLGRDVVNILSIVPVGQNKFIQVVDLADRVLVLGVTDANINLITEITSRDEIDRLRLLSSKSPDEAPQNFNDYLSEFVSGVVNKISSLKKGRAGRTPPAEYEKNEDYLDYLKDQKGRLKKMNGHRDE
jgi:flagellar biogenesis protein FliO